jgi:hypothetical protein
MPFASQAQRKKFYELKEQGKMTQETIDEFEKNTPKDLPKKAIPKKPQSLERRPRRDR